MTRWEGYPKVVLDLSEWPVAAVTLRHVSDKGYGMSLLRNLADQIEAQTQPPRIAEPPDIGTMVTASQVGECDGSERMWIRFSRARTDCWIDTLAHIRSWSDLEGVQP